MKFKAILFDLDGTLLNTLSDIGDAVNRVLSLHGFPVHSIDAYRYFIGDGTMTLIERALPDDKREKNIIQRCREEFSIDYGQHWHVNTFRYRGVDEMLDAICARDIRLSVLSNKPHEFTIRCVEEYLSAWPFEIVLGQQDAIPKKPDPAGALMIAKHLGLSPSDFLFLGDSGIDMQTAVAAGMFPAGAVWGFRTQDELKESGGKKLLNHPMEILPLLD